MDTTKIQERLRKTLAELRTARDELRVDANLLGKDLRAKMKDLEKGLGAVERNVADSMGTLKKLGQEARLSAHLAAMEVKKPSRSKKSSRAKA